MVRPTSEHRDRDQQILSRVARIEFKIDSLEKTTAFALRADAKKHLDEVKKIFNRGKRRAQVYLAANGHRNVQQIAEHLHMQRQSVTKELKVLLEEGVLEIVDTNGSANIWGKNALDRTLRITRFLCAEYSLQSDGRRKK